MAALSDKVVVITGASSGLGRELAVQFARSGARVVAAARDADRLEQTAQACREHGGSARAVPTDVTSESQIANLVRATMRWHERIDVWVNNAGVTLFAPLETASFEEHRRVIETNLYGPMIAARAVLPIFRQQRSGVLINVGSVLSKIGHPFVPSYAISKFALRGLSEALRVELADEPNVHVCTVFPYTMNTPHFQAGANRVGLRPRTMAPDQSPEKVARAIVRLAQRPRRELHVPRIAALGLGLHALMPETTEALLLHALQRWHFEAVLEPTSAGNLFQPKHESAERRPPFDGIHGQRPPRVGTPGLIASIIEDLLVSPVHRALRGTLRRPLQKAAK